MPGGLMQVLANNITSSLPEGLPFFGGRRRKTRKVKKAGRKTRRRGGRAAPPPSVERAVAPAEPEPVVVSDVVHEILDMIAGLSQEEKDRLHEEAQEHGDLSDLQEDPNASAEYNHIAQLIAGLDEEQLEDLAGELGTVLGGRRRKSKKAGRRKSRR